ncbi:limonene-1,2-epoxide hydrolase family protein [Spirillospora sp. CA-255316]
MPTIGGTVIGNAGRVPDRAALVVWESVGRPPRTGKQACLDYLDTLHDTTGMEYCGITVHAIASRGGTVFTEREDRMYRADGSLFMAFRIAGVVVVEHDLITRYTDYFDLSPLTR